MKLKIEQTHQKKWMKTGYYFLKMRISILTQPKDKAALRLHAKGQCKIQYKAVSLLVEFPILSHRPEQGPEENGRRHERLALPLGQRVVTTTVETFEMEGETGVDSKEAEGNSSFTSTAEQDEQSRAAAAFALTLSNVLAAGPQHDDEEVQDFGHKVVTRSDSNTGK